MSSDRTDVPAAWDDRAQLTTMLDYARATVHAKCAGLTDELARQAPLPGSPLMSISGLVGDREMRIATQIPLAGLLAEYESACAHGREIAAAHDLDALSHYKLEGSPFTLRYAMLHLIEETARHTGHLDLLRELADGVTGM
jgi:hypothetical protein